MAQKRFNEKTFNIEMGRTTILYIACSSVRTGYHTSQRAIGTIRYPNPGGNGWQYHREKAYSRYINRPWEVFDYENALHELARKFKNNKYYVVADAILEWCDKHAKGETEAAEKFVSDFKQEWGKARPSLREAVAAGGPIESEEQAKSTLAILKMGNFLNSIE